MKIAVFAYTTAQLYFYKNIISLLESKGHEVNLLIREYREIRGVAEQLELNYFVFSKASSSKFSKILSVPFDIIRASKFIKNNNVDITTGFGLYNTLAGKMSDVPDLTFGDSEPNVNKISYSIQYKLFMPFVKCYVTPSSFRQNMGERHVRVDSFKEMSYLHPKYFQPSIKTIQDLGLEENKYVVLRFNSFDAVHDVGKFGFSDDDKIRLVKLLEK
jgi:predicted glycosyltransferase